MEKHIFAPDPIEKDICALCGKRQHETVHDVESGPGMPPWSEKDRSPTEPIKWAESISERTAQALRDLGWADPNKVEDIKAELSQARATMLVNFGPEGKTQPGLVSGDEKLSWMIVKVFRYYENI